MKQFFLSYYKLHPLRSILIIGLLLRLISVFFSIGYAFTDDHYFVIEEAQFWMDADFGKLPWWKPFITEKDRLPHSLFYTSIHYVLFQFWRILGLENPEIKMIFVRLIHAVYSLLIVWYGFKIARIFSNTKLAIQVAWFLAALWVFPILSVRNLVEFVSIPPLMAMLYLLIRKETPKNKELIYAGLLAGIAFSLRFQTVFISFAFGLLSIYYHSLKRASFIGVGFFICVLLLQGGIDYLFWGIPFHELAGYFQYNLEHSNEYPNGPWYNYILLMIGLVLVPIGLFMTYGLVKNAKKYIWFTLPILLFLIFHSSFPNKQERFILPIIPFFILGGWLSWKDEYNATRENSKLRKIHKNGLIFFAILNTILLIIVSPASTRTGKIGVMNYLREKHVKHFAMESTHKENIEYMPRFYWGVWNHPEQILPNCPSECFYDGVKFFKTPLPEYVVFSDSNNLKNRVEAAKKQMKNLTFEFEVKPSFLDQSLTKLNPRINSQSFFIYKAEYPNGYYGLPRTTGATAIESTSATKATPTRVP